MKRLIVGDIHGCYEEFASLLDKAGWSPGDEIIALGDIVDRGPDPLYLDLDVAVLVHGFFEPEIPLDQQRESIITGTMSGEHHLNEQYVDPWYMLYKGAKPIVVRHRNYSGTKEPFIYKDRVFRMRAS